MLSLAKQLRLKTKRDFKLTLDAGHKTVSINLVIIARPNESGPRLGLIVSRKVGNAVMRNRVKRLIRECFRTQQHQLNHCDYVVIARPKANTAEMKHISRDFSYCMKRLNRRPTQAVTKDMTTCSVQQYA